MTFQSSLPPLTPEERACFGVARAKTIAFDAVHKLWRRRQAEGKSQADLARTLGKDEGWLSLHVDTRQACQQVIVPNGKIAHT